MQQDYPGLDGFLPWRGSLMLDVVFVAMFAVLPVLAYSIRAVAVHKNYLLHKRLQILLGVVLLVTVTIFEIDIRMNGWEERAYKSSFYEGPGDGPIYTVLWIHLFFAVSTSILWIVVTWRALRRFASPPRPGPHSRSHILWARLAALDMACTAITGWIFYYLAFVA